MPRTRPAERQDRKNAPRKLGAGLHLVHVDLGAADSTTVRTQDGRRLSAVLVDGLEPGLVDECRRKGRMMLACDTSRGPTLVGALQTSRTIEHDADGSLTLSAKSVRVVAEQGISMEAGTNASMQLDANGKARLTGDRMVIDMSANVRVLSALVQLP